MALQVAADLIADALVDAARRGHEHIGAFADFVLEWLRDVAQPPRGVELRSDDGATFTGVVLVQSSRVVLMLATRDAPCACTEGSSAVSSSTPQRLVFGSSPGLDPNAPWDRDITFRR